jgi:glyoxylase-like metal-dependent hydrolase (beta-lactamase superfamily II)
MTDRRTGMHTSGGVAQNLSRRRFCLCCVASTTFAATGGWLRPSQVFAQARSAVDIIRSAAATTPITVHRLRGNVSVLEGSGGNIAVLPGPDGKLLVDAGITASRPRIKEALAGLGDQPIKHLINTHWHFDHADGNEWLNQEGATILAHENARKHLMSAQRVEDWNFDFPPSPSRAVPTETMTAEKTIHLNKTALFLKHYPNAHTDGDITVSLPEPDILHTGDIYWNGIYPFIDYSTGGSIDGTISAAGAVLAVAGNETIIIPGHGQPVSNKRELKDYHDMLVAVRDNVAGLKKKGRSLDETVAAKPTADFDAKWGQFVINPAFFTKLVYEGV